MERVHARVPRTFPSNILFPAPCYFLVDHSLIVDIVYWSLWAGTFCFVKGGNESCKISDSLAFLINDVLVPLPDKPLNLLELVRMLFLPFSSVTIPVCLFFPPWCSG
ncbi:hypothetical protein SESBI_33361 [Sesbania bispinosa]|nr:hypothetical protein SESBI_33361 [Sesbania bispinosa]